MRSSVLIYVVRGFPSGVPWFLHNFFGVYGWGLDGRFFFVLVIIFAFCLGFVLMHYTLHIARHLAADFRTFFSLLI